MNPQSFTLPLDPGTLSPLAVISRFPAHDNTLMSLLASRVRHQPEREFIVFQGASFTYADVLREVEATARALTARGVKPGDRVGVMSLNHPSTAFIFFALAHLGAIMVSVNADYGVEEVRYVFDHAGVCGVIAAPEAVRTAQVACAAIEPRPWFALNRPGPGDVAPLAATAGAAQAMVTPGGAPEATCMLVYTSGTTGFPKGVMHSQRGVVLAAEGFVARMYLQPDERLLCVLPMFHINAVCYSLCGALAAGAVLILEPRFSASRFWEVAHATGATEVNTIAAAAGILMRRPRSEYRPGHKLRKMFGAPFDDEVYRVFHDEFDMPHVIEGFGMSEIPGAMNNPFAGERRMRSMGKPSIHPDPSVKLTELKIVDAAGHTVDTGVTGELAVKTPTMMLGYFRDAEQTRAAFRDGWFMTGDLAWHDKDGYYWFVARKKDIIRKRGENISGAELDRVIGNHPAVQEAAAIPVPSDLGEDDILTAIVVREGMQVTAQEIADWCRKHLAPIKVPRYVTIVDALPHTPTLRVEKFKMRQDKTLLARAVDLGA